MLVAEYKEFRQGRYNKKKIHNTHVISACHTNMYISAGVKYNSSIFFDIITYYFKYLSHSYVSLKGQYSDMT